MSKRKVSTGAEAARISVWSASLIGTSAYAKSWFYLGHGQAVRDQGDRYLHPGRGSLGCITVDPAGWTQLYRYLILCRSGDGKTVGRVVVVR